MKWTYELPTEKGWYLFARYGDKEQLIYLFKEDGVEGICLSTLLGPARLLMFDNQDIAWYGPMATAPKMVVEQTRLGELRLVYEE